MKKYIYYFALLIGIATTIYLSFLPSGTVPVSHDSGAVFDSPIGEGGGVSLRPLRSVLAIQQDVNCVLASYGKQLIQEDGVWGPRTASAYLEAYSLQQAEEVDRGHYER